MKYIKKFENDKNNIVNNPVHYGVDYELNSEIEKYKKAKELLDANNISYDIYYYEDKKFHNNKMEYIKIYGHSHITYKQFSILEKNHFWIFDNYHFTWDWKKISEEELNLLIDIKKFNL